MLIVIKVLLLINHVCDWRHLFRYVLVHLVHGLLRSHLTLIAIVLYLLRDHLRVSLLWVIALLASPFFCLSSLKLLLGSLIVFSRIVFLNLFVLVKRTFRSIGFAAPTNKSTLYFISSPTVSSSDPIVASFAFRVTINNFVFINLLVSNHVWLRVNENALLLVRSTILVLHVFWLTLSLHHLRNLLLCRRLLVFSLLRIDVELLLLLLGRELSWSRSSLSRRLIISLSSRLNLRRDLLILILSGLFSQLLLCYFLFI